MAPQFLARFLPLLFVVLSGSGFVGAKLGLPHAEPFVFLALRFALAALVLGLLAGLLGSPWPRRRRDALHIAGAGLLTAGVFSAGVFYSIALGLPPAVSALIIALQPILVGLAAGPLLGERIGARRWGGLLLGLFGVYLVLRQRLALDPAYLRAALLSVVGLCGMAAGNLYQKARCGQMDVFSGGAIQNFVCALFMLAGATLWESGEVRWNWDFVVALGWMSLVVSVGAVSMLAVMIRCSELSRVAGVFYLLPVSAALTAFLVFGQGIDGAALVGIGVTAGGVMLASFERRPR